MKIKKENIVLIFTVIYIIFICVINIILNQYNWHLKNWVLTLSFFIIHIGAIIFSILKICKIKSKLKRIVIFIIGSIICWNVIHINYIFFNLTIKNEIIREIDGKEYIGIEHLTNRLRKTIYYYDKHNIFAYKTNNLLIKEFYNYDDYDVPLYRTYYQNNKEKRTLIFHKDGNVTEKNKL